MAHLPFSKGCEPILTFLLLLINSHSFSKQLSANLPQIKSMPIEKLQQQGFIFVWAINAKYSFACTLIEKWGYKVVDEITWVKKTVNGKIAPSHGFYLQHAGRLFDVIMMDPPWYSSRKAALSG